jgi:ornithine cyclodeaminase
MNIQNIRGDFMKIIEKDEVRKLLTAENCVALMKKALIELETGESGQPPRLITCMPNSAKFGFMPAYAGKEYFGAKIIAAYAPNIGTEYPSHIGYIMLFESEHCTVKALVEAGTITEIRTGAVSAVATELLARKDAKSLALIGAGAQARSHTAAIRTVRELSGITVYDIRRVSAEEYKREIESTYNIPVRICGSVEETVKDADIVCTLTPGKEPILFRSMIRPGTHINAVGTFSPTTREASSDVIAASRLYADQVEAMKRESGEYLIPLQEGLIKDTHIIGSIGALLLGQIKGRTSDDDITLFDALGLAVEDVTCARFVYELSL